MNYEYAATVIDVHDGDTIRVDIDLGFDVQLRSVPLRLVGINAPELPTEAGKASRDFLSTYLPDGAAVVVHTVKDKKEKYGRYLAVVFCCEQNVNDLLVETGHAVPWDGKGQRP